MLRRFVTADALVHPEGGARQSKRWMQDNAALIRHSVLALVSIVPASEYERMKKLDFEKAFGVPGALFADRQPALAWLDRDVFTPRGLPLDRAGIRAALARAAACDR